MAFEGHRLKLCSVLALAAVGLQGCGTGGNKPSPGPSPSPSPSPLGPTTTTLLTTTTSPNSTSKTHCKAFDDSHGCTACDDGFDLKEGQCFYNCMTEKYFNVSMGPRKGLCIDDTSFQFCADEIPHIWPNTKEPLGSIRVFSSWQSFWPDEGREQAWESLVNLVKKNNMQVFIGTQITCNETEDDHDWSQVLTLMKMLGSEHIMGLSVGNELELLYQKDYVKKLPKCIPRIWKGGYFWEKTVDRVKDMDALGKDFSKIPVTSVFGSYAMAGNPFLEIPDAMVNSYLKNATEVYGKRWVFTFNVYPYLDGSLPYPDPGTKDSCTKAIAQSTCYDKHTCLYVSIMSALRLKIKQMTKADDDLFWIGETGWSSPQASSLNDKPLGRCPAFSTIDAFESYYSGFLNWDFSLPQTGVKGPDHVFYFTHHDSDNFGYPEHFGLVKTCGVMQCKLQARGATVGAGDILDRVIV